MSDTARTMRTALVGIAGVVLVVAAALNADRLPIVGIGGTRYQAELTDASGLAPGDPVKVAGVAAGTVREIDIDGDRVTVSFELDEDVRLGDRTEAAVGSGSLLGDKYLKVVPLGSGDLAEGAVIPLARTEAAYDVVDAFADLTDTTGRLDADRIAEALTTVADTFRGSEREVRAAVSGLTRLSGTIARRDAELQQLLAHATEVSGVLADRRGDLSRLLRSSNLLLGELERRREAIGALLVSSRELSDALHGVVVDNQERLTPALRDLAGVTELLAGRQRELRATIRNLEVYGRYYTNVVGSGPWFDNYIPRIPDSVQVEVGR